MTDLLIVDPLGATCVGNTHPLVVASTSAGSRTGVASGRTGQR